MNSIPISQMLFDIYNKVSELEDSTWNYHYPEYGDFYVYNDLDNVLNIELTIDIDYDWECRYVTFNMLTNQLDIDEDVPNDQLLDRLRWIYIQLCLK